MKINEIINKQNIFPIVFVFILLDCTCLKAQQEATWYWRDTARQLQGIVRYTDSQDHSSHRRRIKTEEKAEVVAVVWCMELIHFLWFWRIGWVHLFFKSSWCKSSYSSNCPSGNSKCGKKLNNFCPQTSATTFAFSSVFIILLCCSVDHSFLRVHSCPCLRKDFPVHACAKNFPVHTCAKKLSCPRLRKIISIASGTSISWSGFHIKKILMLYSALAEAGEGRMPDPPQLVNIRWCLCRHTAISQVRYSASTATEIRSQSWRVNRLIEKPSQLPHPPIGITEVE